MNAVAEQIKSKFRSTVQWKPAEFAIEVDLHWQRLQAAYPHPAELRRLTAEEHRKLWEIDRMAGEKSAAGDMLGFREQLARLERAYAIFFASPTPLAGSWDAADLEYQAGIPGRITARLERESRIKAEREQAKADRAKVIAESIQKFEGDRPRLEALVKLESEMIAHGLNLDFKNQREKLLAWNSQTVEEISARFLKLNSKPESKPDQKPESEPGSKPELRQTPGNAAPPQAGANRPPTPPKVARGASEGQMRKPEQSGNIATGGAAEVVRPPTPGVPGGGGGGVSGNDGGAPGNGGVDSVNTQGAAAKIAQKKIVFEI